MKCTRHKPEACFNCTLPECIDEEDLTAEEWKILNDARKAKPLSNNPRSVYSREYYKKNKEYYKEYGKKYRAKNREKLNAYRNKWYYEHREEELERQRAYDQRKRDANGN